MSKLDELSDDEYNRFYDSLKFTINWEKGYVNDPKDPGGETKWGISKTFHPNEDIKNLTPERAAEIYYLEYWQPSGANFLQYPLCAVVFDTAVLCGVGRAVRWLRESKGDPNVLVNLRRNHHVDRVKQKPNQKKFLVGWLNRTNDLIKLIEIQKAG